MNERDKTTLLELVATLREMGIYAEADEDADRFFRLADRIQEIADAEQEDVVLEWKEMQVGTHEENNITSWSESYQGDYRMVVCDTGKSAEKNICRATIDCLRDFDGEHEAQEFITRRLQLWRMNDDK